MDSMCWISKSFDNGIGFHLSVGVYCCLFGESSAARFLEQLVFLLLRDIDHMEQVEVPLCDQSVLAILVIIRYFDDTHECNRAHFLIATPLYIYAQSALRTVRSEFLLMTPLIPSMCVVPMISRMS
ncbi:hypothetical protein Tco_0858238 [Tanacetum coccineum]|uniref:Uncharacterized protein n=1 Tax=Tanacetum coccineum TaxID=301880 RepID=A0ABQ5B8J4_9ASTR